MIMLQTIYKVLLTKIGLDFIIVVSIIYVQALVG